MAVIRPYRRTCRPFLDGKYSLGGHWQYVTHPKFAKSPEHYVRAFLLISKDLQDLFDYIEPADKNIDCYSFRIHALLVRACIEVEANCKAILSENGYKKPVNWDINDYKKINTTHRLSSYQAKVPYWSGNKDTRSPFSAWSTGGSLSWYQDYNSTKHDRYSEFTKASFGNLLDACCGLLVILSAQFGTYEFSPGNMLISFTGPNAIVGMEFGIGRYFQVKFPDDFPEEDRYDFNWADIKNEEDPFQTIDYL